MLLPPDIPTRAEIDRLLNVTDDIARRAWLSGARVLAVRDRDIPGQGAVAAILRYPL